MKNLKSKVIKLGMALLLTVLLYSCGESKPKGWSEEDKSEFLKGCVNSNKGAVSDEKATLMCTCMLDKMSEKYATMVESQKMNVDELREIAISCR
ncbi:hypothetical protein H0I23_00955 [Cellulophaga sp. HaHaR_3_176]|uniref:hypothetical protein n=1 Tax=Cellulophaga sp. HaHaR_3_176 TaxID=1942464 RepID=UPI001C1FF9C7|nr:hypothetical protein [Cellulophaga sp. HaHaR_3_176]QWX84252.1 hypothetical protein H0I23_00955 [Cellulophaga sp. HaHaR_3_176]